MTIHSSHPFPTADDPVRRLRGRLPSAVTLWTAGAGADRAGLTVSSVMVAGGSPGRVLALLDPDADLTVQLEESGAALLHVLDARHRELADAFAGVTPAPGGAFRLGEFVDTGEGPRLAGVGALAVLRLEDARDVGWSRIVTCAVEDVSFEDVPGDPLVHHRGRYLR